MESSDSSYLYEITDTQEEVVEQQFQKEKLISVKLKEKADLERKLLFDKYIVGSVKALRLNGLTFHTIRHSKIKFSFIPSKISDFITNKSIFYVSLKYEKYNWMIKRDSLPVNCKLDVYKLFYGPHFFAITDENIIKLIERIYEILVLWTNRNERFRLQKFQRYQNGEDVELDSEDEEIFLSEQERIKRHEKRIQILRRMIPPKGQKCLRLI